MAHIKANTILPMGVVDWNFLCGSLGYLHFLPLHMTACIFWFLFHAWRGMKDRSALLSIIPVVLIDLGCAGIFGGTRCRWRNWICTVVIYTLLHTDIAFNMYVYKQRMYSTYSRRAERNAPGTGVLIRPEWRHGTFTRSLLLLKRFWWQMHTPKCSAGLAYACRWQDPFIFTRSVKEFL